MLSDEEKKAIKVINKRTERLIEELKIEEEDLIDEPKIAYLITQIEANKTLLNLIEKQQREIEELTLDLEEMTKSNNHKKENWVHKNILNSYVGKDKIKAKIEELEKGNKNTFIRGEKILVLQSLLEKE